MIMCFKQLFRVTVGCLFVSGMANASICEHDDRKKIMMPEAGYSVSNDRVHNPGSCTVTMFSENCAISAGHCLHVLGQVRFPGDNIFEVERGSIRAISSRIGNNWAVFRLGKSKITGHSAGMTQGYVKLETTYDADLPDRLWAVAENANRDLDINPSNSQLYSLGEFLWDSDSAVYHALDMGKGSGGALLFDSTTNKAYAIHTHGGCDIMGNNKGTIIGRVPNLVKAINECKALDK